MLDKEDEFTLGTGNLSRSHAVAKTTLDALARANVAPGKQKFDDERDRILCSELKNLYMCLTRSKMNLWIYDEGQRGYKFPMGSLLECSCVFCV